MTADLLTGALGAGFVVALITLMVVREVRRQLRPELTGRRATLSVSATIALLCLFVTVIVARFVYLS